MILTYNDCKNKYGSQYNINKAIKNGELYQLEKGIYSYKSYEPELQIISTKYPNAVFTMNSAFYYHNLTDTIPEKYHLATSKSSAAISDKRVIQRYENSATLELGVIIKEIDSGVSIRIYNKERMLLELIRNKNNIPFTNCHALVPLTICSNLTAKKITITKSINNITNFIGYCCSSSKYSTILFS